ncbi:DUF2071 domain-containing protein [Neobacillus dielmonensis]
MYFFEFDANHLPSVLGAKAISLPYRLAKMEMTRRHDGISFHSKQV